jgi:hypothetical protein
MAVVRRQAEDAVKNHFYSSHPKIVGQSSCKLVDSGEGVVVGKYYDYECTVAVDVPGRGRERFTDAVTCFDSPPTPGNCPADTAHLVQ